MELQGAMKDLVERVGDDSPKGEKVVFVLATALHDIANQDYRGPRPYEQQMAASALERASKLLETL